MTLPRLSQAPRDPAFVQDPYPFYDRLRGAGPLVQWTDYGMAATASYDVVKHVLRDRRFGREPVTPPQIAEDLAPFYAVEAHSMLEREPPDHTRLRGLVNRAFTSARIAGLAPVIAKIAQDLIGQFPKGPFDLLDAFARPLPVQVIAHMLGVPVARAPDLLAWSNAMVRMYMAGRTQEDERDAVAATQAFSKMLEDVIAKRRKTPGEDLLSALIAARDNHARLSDQELIANVILLLNAGHEATVHTIGNGVKAILGCGATEATQDPARAPSVVEEVLRFDPPLHLFTRWAYEDMDLGGHPIRRGDQVACLLAAANRDPVAYERPDAFMPDRTGPTAMGFGAGIHFCVGAPLARLELQIAFAQLFAACPSLSLAEPPIYADIYHFHGLKRLMVTT